MNADEYNKIKRFCHKNLRKEFHDRYLDDVTQYVAMKIFECNGERSWKYILIDYLRANAVVSIDNAHCNKKQAVLGKSLSIDKELGEGNNSEYLAYEIALEKHKESLKGDLTLEQMIVDELHKKLSFKKDTMEWMKKNLKVNKSFSAKQISYKQRPFPKAKTVLKRIQGRQDRILNLYKKNSI